MWEVLINYSKLEKGEFAVENKIPYADIEHLDDPELMAIVEEDGYIWGHTLEDQIQGQIDAGFAIVGFYEDIGGTALDQYINTSMATVRRHIVGGANRTLISVKTPSRSCRIGT